MKGIFRSSFHELSPPHFLPILGRKLYGKPGVKKNLGPTIYFPSYLSNQIHSKKVYLPIFFPKFSIHLISPPNKHTFFLFLFSFFSFSRYWVFGLQCLWEQKLEKIKASTLPIAVQNTKPKEQSLRNIKTFFYI